MRLLACDSLLWLEFPKSTNCVANLHKDRWLWLGRESTQSVHYKVWLSASAFSYGSPAFIMTMMAMMTMMTLLTMITMITMNNMKIMMKVHKVYKQGLSGCNSLQSRVVPTPAAHGEYISTSGEHL